MKTIPQLKLMTKVQLINEREDILTKETNARNRLRMIHAKHPDVSILTNNLRAYNDQLEIIKELIKTAK